MLGALFWASALIFKRGTAFFGDFYRNIRFNDTATSQYERTLLFSTCMKLMIGVTLKNSPSLHQAMLVHEDEIPVSFKAVYDKINGLDTTVSRELVCDSFRNLSPIVSILHAKTTPLLPGFRIKMIDGNHFAATEKRLKPIRNTTAGALPGQAVAVYEPEFDMVSDLIPCKDGHSSERTLTDGVIEGVIKNDCIIADRNFCFFDFLLKIAHRCGFFVIRHHGGLTNYTVLEKKRLVGVSETGSVYEQRIEITRKEGSLVLRRITVKLLQKTGDGEKEIHILTNLKSEEADAIKVSELYRSRWKIEGMFQVLTQSLCCEIDTLGYPSAAVFAFSLAVKAYNGVSLIKGAMRKEHGESEVNDLSWYNICTEIGMVWGGMEIAIGVKEWVRLVTELSDREFAKLLCQLVSGMKLKRYRKSVRGPKKKSVHKKSVYAGNHISTEEFLKSPKAPKTKR